MMEYLTKLASLVVAIFKLISGILAAVNGEEESEETAEMLNGIGSAFSEFANSLSDIEAE